MTDEQPSRSYLAEAFHCAFASTYRALARQKYPRLMRNLPFHGQDVHVLQGGNRWWHIVCMPGLRSANMRFGPTGRFSMETAEVSTYPDLATLRDDAEPRQREFRRATAVDFFIYHQSFAEPWPSAENELTSAAAELAARLVDEHARPLLEIEGLKGRVSTMRNAHLLLQDMQEARACLQSEHYRAAIATAYAAAEAAMVGRLEELGHPIRQEERARLLGHEHHYFSSMVAELYRRSAITLKTRERLELLDGLRRGTEHCRPDATAQDDAQYTWEAFKQLLLDLTR